MSNAGQVLRMHTKLAKPQSTKGRRENGENKEMKGKLAKNEEWRQTVKRKAKRAKQTDEEKNVNI